MSKQSSSEAKLQIPPLSPEEEDALIHTRITNDERPLRRTTKKFHVYTSVAYPPIVPPPPWTTSSVEEAREAFLVELASFQLLLKKSVLVCEAEARQVEEYQREKERIVSEREELRKQIEQLKIDLEQAQIERRRKIEYDQIAERINTLPSREELNISISELENDMQVIRGEQETQSRMIQARKSALDGIVSDLSVLRLLGKDTTEVSQAPSPAPDGDNNPAAGDEADDAGVKDGQVGGSTDSGETGEEKESRALSSTPSASSLNPTAKSFQPRTSSPLLHSVTSRQLRRRGENVFSAVGDEEGVVDDDAPGSPLPSDVELKGEEESKKEDGEEDEDDIEMGEVSEEKVKSSPRKTREDREEGEASDESSELSEPPDE